MGKRWDYVKDTFFYRNMSDRSKGFTEGLYYSGLITIMGDILAGLMPLEDHEVGYGAGFGSGLIIAGFALNNFKRWQIQKELSDKLNRAEQLPFLQDQ